MYKYLCTIVSIQFFISCHHNRKHTAVDKLVKANYLSQYNFEKPDATIELPKELKEISGISFLNDSEGYSFPSGHACIAFNYATILMLEYKKWCVSVPAYL